VATRRLLLYLIPLYSSIDNIARMTNKPSRYSRRNSRRDGGYNGGPNDIEINATNNVKL